MKRIFLNEDWPGAWKSSYAFDLEEVYGEIQNYGYAYAYRNRQKETFKLINYALSKGARILDIAAAQGNFSLKLAELGYDVTWNDLRGELEGYVRLKYERGKLSFVSGNAFELDFPELFDAILITEVIEHVAHPDEFLANASKLVKPGGVVIMTTPNGAYFRNKLPKFSDCEDPGVYEKVQFKPDSDGHIFLLHPDEIEPLASKSGLNVEKLKLFTNPLTNGHMKLHMLLRVLPRGIVHLVEMLTLGLPFFISKKMQLQMGAIFRKPIV